MGLPWGTIAFGMVKNPLRGVRPPPESFPPVKETKIMKIKTIRNIPPSKSNPSLHLCSKDISETPAKESDYSFKYFTF